VAKAMRKMQTPAYWPVFVGVKELVQRGVVVDVKKSISIVVIDMSIEDIESLVEVGMAMSMVVEVPISMAMVELMSMSIILTKLWRRYRGKPLRRATTVMSFKKIKTRECQEKSQDLRLRWTTIEETACQELQPGISQIKYRHHQPEKYDLMCSVQGSIGLNKGNTHHKRGRP